MTTWTSDELKKIEAAEGEATGHPAGGRAHLPYSAPERCNTTRCFTTPNREIARSDSRSEMDRSRRSLRASNAAPLCTGQSGGNLVAEVVVPRPSQAIMR